MKIKQTNKKVVSTILCSFLVTTLVYASPKKEPKLTNEVDATYDVEKGWDFYENEETKKSITKKSNLKEKETVIELLKQIRDENKKQTDIQKEMLDILKKKIDPQPKVVVVDGKECIANASSDCFHYESLVENNPEVQKVPTLLKALSNPYDMNNIADYLKWQTNLFKHIGNIGNGFQLSIEQFGDKATNSSTNRSSLTSATGIMETIKPKAKIKYINNKKDKLSFKVFLGLNNKLDLYSLSSLENITAQHKDMNFEVVFDNEESRNIIVEGVSLLLTKDNNAWKSSKKTVSQDMFNDYGIYTTPSFVAVYEDKPNGIDKVQTIGVGKISSGLFAERVINFLEYNKLYNSSELSDYKIWEDNVDDKFINDHYIKNYGIKVIKEKGEIKDEK